MKRKFIFVIPLMLLFTLITQQLMAQQQPALCKRTAFATKSAVVECPNGVTFTITASGVGEYDDPDCTVAQIVANIVADLDAASNLGAALSYVKCPEPEPEGGEEPGDDPGNGGDPEVPIEPNFLQNDYISATQILLPWSNVFTIG